MTYITMLFLTRKPTLTPEQFKAYYETKHIPYIKSLSGHLSPLRHRRWYLAHAGSEGSADPTIPNYPPLVLRGTSEEFDYDCIAEISWEDANTFQEFSKLLMDEEIAAKLAVDEEQFLVREKLRAVAIGEVIETLRDELKGREHD
ncbi:hypothetical protein N0V90_000463 [Kalmusia sp. IMI 367209]|nr:hypothetical protein N0V90_000463 [Kalmusia sp. IMI 367209]